MKNNNKVTTWHDVLVGENWLQGSVALDSLYSMDEFHLKVTRVGIRIRVQKELSKFGFDVSASEIGKYIVFLPNFPTILYV